MTGPPAPVVADFLRGVSDGDGSVMFVKNRKMPGGISLRASIVCYPERDRLFLAQLLGIIGVPHSVVAKAIRMDGSQAEMFCKAIYTGTGTRLARKHSVWIDWCSRRAKVGGLISERDPYASLRGIRPQSWHKWFGKLPDKDIAERAGKSMSAVALARKKLCIEPVTPERGNAPRPWHAMVGTMPDSHVAARFDLSPVTVLLYRRKMSLPVYVESRRPAWHAKVGTMPDSALARQIGIDRSTIANHRRRYDLPAPRSL